MEARGGRDPRRSSRESGESGGSRGPVRAAKARRGENPRPTALGRAPAGASPVESVARHPAGPSALEGGATPPGALVAARGRNRVRRDGTGGRSAPREKEKGGGREAPARYSDAFEASYIMPPMPPMSGIAGWAEPFGSGLSATIASVVMRSAATEAASSSA